MRYIVTKSRMTDLEYILVADKEPIRLFRDHPLKISWRKSSTDLHPLDLPWEIVVEILNYCLADGIRNCQFKFAMNLISINKRMLLSFYKGIYGEFPVGRPKTRGKVTTCSIDFVLINRRLAKTFVLITDIITTMKVDTSTICGGDYDDLEMPVLNLDYREIKRRVVHDMHIKPYELEFKELTLEMPTYQGYARTMHATTFALEGIAYTDGVPDETGVALFSEINRPVILLDIIPSLISRRRIFHGRVLHASSWIFVVAVLNTIYKSNDPLSTPKVLFGVNTRDDFVDIQTLLSLYLVELKPQNF